MFLDEFHTVIDGRIVVSAAQASRFAKEVAGDFNPIHDPEAKRFVVPGDLLFALAMSKYGLGQRMSVSFSGMVGKDKPLNLPDNHQGVIEITDDAGKVYTHVEHHGEVSHDRALIEAVIRSYVAFSGQNFPYILVPLLEKHQVMFNPRRPLVIYESMSFELDRVAIAQPELALVNSTLDVNGKRGDAHFIFEIRDGDEVIGKGDKKLIVSGLQPYDAELMGRVVDDFELLKSAYRPSAPA
ncbi:DUF3581 family protein [Reinekea forsetii]|uniref:DUF3581 domain-containing protein n=1 Tax=Reinekea forsetii TaxID=1336806 RepID=A0A2K8KN29_9GAMM|nr:DUF3581 family protein [Reinekea forsetii]ATX76227.1 hypothetical protein REIFOR_01074 [Reinekea forsetii]